MNNIVGLACLALGIVLLILGFSQTQPADPAVLGGQPAHHSLWLLLGGGVAVVGGLLLALSGIRRE